MEKLNVFLNGLVKGSFGIELVAVTEPRMNKKGNPYFGRVRKQTRMTNIALGVSYENIVNARLEREDKVANFISQAPKGRFWINSYILGNTKDNTKKYLRTIMRRNTKVENIFYLDGYPVYGEELEVIKAWIAPSVKPTNQGLDDENLEIVRDFSIENIIYIKQGKKEYCR